MLVTGRILPLVKFAQLLWFLFALLSTLLALSSAGTSRHGPPSVEYSAGQSDPSGTVRVRFKAPTRQDSRTESFEDRHHWKQAAAAAALLLQQERRAFQIRLRPRTRRWAVGFT
ncbi:hypothetical protein HO173_003451 [Letharia columbiana]|uniref:Secreted protein n=1 Tax=Letharia columbiana TaxID=112416 RepID=A0A8H6G145_9LECA|nr:uncharacterized protein HO173_003451 [Letharia columbiana]KAF6238483.1 hypothetical protein HO173_003451 [Letharia columbiana]